MSNMKGGFSTLNRWFGRKKDKSGTGSSSMGKLSKSSTQLHHLSTDTDINETSQLEYNRITPVPAATSNAPFEQTFRITVLLPKDQLFVARLGARVPLSKLLSLVCDNKQLDAEKYEFRSPVDASQVYSCESTIGAVGLSEIRLCHKSESYDNFNPDVMHKFQRTGVARDSLSSSSDFSSSRHSKVTAKTPSPYSSSNSLNSMDSTGMNYTRTPVVVPPAKILAPPPRKKRTAPRPPSQICIPEQSVPDIPAANLKSEPAYAVIVKRPQLCMSTPNLSGPPEVDCNGNSSKSPDDDSVDGHYATLDLKPPVAGGPEPTPRKRLLQIKKKTAPAPPPDFQSGGDNVSLASLPEPVTPTPNVPQPAPRITTPLPIAPATNPPLPQINGNVNGNGNGSPPTNGNVSKVLLNRTPTPEPRSLGSATEDDDNDTASKQADSGIGEPAPSPSASPEPEAEKSQQESSSEDDEAIKVYNFKLCQTSKKGEPIATSLAELAVLTAQEIDEEEEEKLQMQQQVTRTNGILATPSSETSLSSWNYSVPISPPPDFSDQQMQTRNAASLSSGSPLDEIVDELATIIHQQRLDTLIKKQPDPRLAEIEAAKPNRLANFSIATAKSTTRIGRADSFQAGGSGGEAEVTSSGGGTLSLRSSSHVSLNKLEQNGNGLGQRRSSSELSIGESPSLQSLEVIKTILNSRKNSLAESGGSASSPVTEQPKIIKELENLTKEKPSSVTDAKAISPSPNSIPKQSPTPVQKQSPTPVQKQSPPTVEKPLSAIQKVEQEPSSIQKQSPPSPVLKQSPTPKQKQQPSPVEKSSLPPVVTTVQEQVTLVVQKEPAVQKQSPPVAKKMTPLPTPKPSPPSVIKVPEPSPPPVQKLLIQPTVQPIKEETSVSTSSRNTITPPNSPATPVSPVNLRNPENRKVETQTSQQIESAPSSKPLPPTYRYSGPPSINFATWSERPKSTVAIKNEGDYIFGGAGKSQKVTSPPPAKLTIEVASPILRMGIPQRKEYHVPITVKPLKDVSQENQQQDKPEVPVAVEKEQQIQEETFSVQVKLKTPAKPLEKPQVQTQNTIQNQSSTLPRPAKSNRFTLPAGNSNHQVASSLASNSLPRPVSSLERNRPVEANPAPAPFGQNTLRRTGFKERMLAREQQEQEQALRIRVSVNGTTSSPPPPPAATPTSPPESKPAPPAKNVNVVLKSTKVELKLQEPEINGRPVSLQVKLKPTSQPVATPSPPPPPAPQMVPALKPVKTNGTRSGLITPDPRSQLLDAIRNFKREELNRS
ncbi:nascent polypeptide-associated complex subunit alpha, muscle-specific form [Drosophila rhopaloa]|uniref:Nascent polypeptide-associated complex subunit alpha, muscle-specific form n=1 Tax=Drosophila rhopaloa TaxID=1041015 RepID=A0A6P4FAG5_DRORH|nr:nascent polypeptide-associated complex subunit alpha, muscle-specific form [Drosophila rhopaloa]XP_016982421.1 nascent polypeptide-associated complex subunit alpha, muscle-specific form [Drosophila rhopaloa]XP_016982423.1 nascent polypeptide-associated complex subunit alpha, muscle-specific form [Drosophila rhopaloa]XP_016982424.1 nascent polypeptide-associated complex subunit alpha, muscle-specific form [Drosophila rhopaloa]